MHTGVWRKAPIPSCRAPGDGAPPPPAFLSPIHAESAGARKFAELHCGCRRGCAGAPAGTPRRRSPRHRGAHLSTSPGRPERACPGGKVTVTLKSWTPSSKNFSPVRLARARRPGSRRAVEGTLRAGAALPSSRRRPVRRSLGRWPRRQRTGCGVSAARGKGPGEAPGALGTRVRCRPARVGREPGRNLERGGASSALRAPSASARR